MASVSTEGSSLGQDREASQEGEVGEDDGVDGDGGDPEGDVCQQHLSVLEEQEEEELSLHVDSHSAQHLELELPPRLRSFEQPSRSGALNGHGGQSHAHSSRKQVAECVHCQGRFRGSAMRLDGKLCANCFKIYESVSRTAEAHGGSFRLVVRRPGSVSLELSCARGHHWSLGMQSRKAKNWCRSCKDEARAEQEREQEEHLHRFREEQRLAQQALFEEARLLQESEEPEPESPAQESSHLQQQRLRLHHVLVN